MTLKDMSKWWKEMPRNLGRSLKSIMVRHTRRQGERLYGNDLKKQEIGFPLVNDPVPLLYQLNLIESRIVHDYLGKYYIADFHYHHCHQPLSEATRGATKNVPYKGST